MKLVQALVYMFKKSTNPSFVRIRLRLAHDSMFHLIFSNVAKYFIREFDNIKEW